MKKELNFYNLDPSVVLDAVESLGLRVTGKYYQLNSYENRVFDIEIEEGLKELNEKSQVSALGAEAKSLIIKFYRPNRWSKSCIQEEHDFTRELNKSGVSAVSPFFIDGNSIFERHGMFFSLFPKAYGRMPQELDELSLQSIGRILARLHNVGDQKKSVHRPWLDIETYGDQSLEFSSNFIYPDLKEKYLDCSYNILDRLDDALQSLKYLRIHGDCHKGNILQTDPREGLKEYFFVDFDDFCMGPAIQDFWMLMTDLKDVDPENNFELKNILQGYSELREFDLNSLVLIPLFQGLRIIYYAGWIAKRWDDPSFQKLFPQFKDYNYWAQELQILEEISKR